MVKTTDTSTFHQSKLLVFNFQSLHFDCHVFVIFECSLSIGLESLEFTELCNKASVFVRQKSIFIFEKSVLISYGGVDSTHIIANLSRVSSHILVFLPTYRQDVNRLSEDSSTLSSASICVINNNVDI